MTDTVKPLIMQCDSVRGRHFTTGMKFKFSLVIYVPRYQEYKSSSLELFFCCLEVLKIS